MTSKNQSIGQILDDTVADLIQRVTRLEEQIRRLERGSAPVVTATERAKTVDRTPSEYMTTDELCELLHMSAITAAQWRQRGYGPAYLRIGRTIRYGRVDVDAWLKRVAVPSRAR